MNAIECPSCKTTLPSEEITSGWCETCGKRIPAYVLSEARGAYAKSGESGGVGIALSPMAVSTATDDSKPQPRRLLIFGVVFICGALGAIVGAALDGFRSGSRSEHIGMMAGIGIGAGIAQAFGLMGKKKDA